MSKFFTLAILVALSAACSKQSQPSAEQEPALVQEEEAKEAEAPPAKAESKIAWLRDLDEAQALASEQERDLLIDFSAVWCAPCEEMDKTTFADADTARFLSERFVPLKLDVSEQTDADKALMDRFFVKVLPALLVVRGEEVLLAIDTYVGPEELQKRLNALEAGEKSPN
jgi:thiol:disulfide interchange protein